MFIWYIINFKLQKFFKELLLNYKCIHRSSLIILIVMKYYIITVLLLLVVAQSRVYTVANDENCMVSSQGRCIICKDRFKPLRGKCYPDETKANINKPDFQELFRGDQTDKEIYEICKGKDYCGEAIKMNAKEFFEFYDKYTPKPITPIYRPLPVLRGNVAVADQPMVMSKTMAMTAQSNSVSAPAMRAADTAGSATESRDFSQTNNQVQNVDQADIIKTDGTYIYSISRGDLSIIKAFPYTDAGVQSTITLKQQPQGLFIEQNYLAVFGTEYSYNQNIYKRDYVAQNSPNKVFIHVYDTTNKCKPKLINEYAVEGNYFNGRKANGFIYILSTSYMSGRQKIQPFYENGNARKNIDSIYRYSIEYRYPSLINIFALNLKDPNCKKNFNVITVISENAQNLYMSEKNIYITFTNYQDWQSLETYIHKIFVKGANIIPFADGKVKGTILNQFSMDEHEKNFRIATTYDTQVNNVRQSSSNVFIMDFYLNTVGSLTGIAPTERIFSTRFIGDRLYMVTFRQVDPFFVISLANPRNPKILGELKIPGFSRYLHPYDQNTIIGIGRQADANGRQLGLKISLFDVTNVQKPTQTATFELDQKYASSTAEFEHKAFLFSREKNLLVIPVNNYVYNNAQLSFNGAFAFYIDKQNIQLESLIDHFSGNFNQFYEDSVERSLYIENLLYTKSLCSLHITSLDSYEGVLQLKLPCNAIVQPRPYPILYDTPILIGRPVEPIGGPVLMASASNAV